jgi:hypothetical protein
MHANPSAAFQLLARRLRYLRRYPPEMCGRAMSRSEREAAALAYEYALRVSIDEMGERENFHALMYGPQNEDPDLGYPA